MLNGAHPHVQAVVYPVRPKRYAGASCCPAERRAHDLDTFVPGVVPGKIERGLSADRVKLIGFRILYPPNVGDYQPFNRCIPTLCEGKAAAAPLELEPSRATRMLRIIRHTPPP
jgi:hypothetical protein